MEPQQTSVSVMTGVLTNKPEAMLLESIASPGPGSGSSPTDKFHQCGRSPSPPVQCPHLKEHVQTTAASPPGAAAALEVSNNTKKHAALLAEKFLILDPIDGSSLHRCFDVQTEEELMCKIVTRGCGDTLLSAHFLVESLPHINHIKEMVVGAEHSYLMFPKSCGDLHSHVRSKKRLREPEAKRLFRQMVTTIRDCHELGVVLRDLKLRKFVFTDQFRTQIKLESLEDAVVLDDPLQDALQDKKGCPAYVAPEILRARQDYSGRSADMWSLGVILYTMLVGRYPFNDSEHASLFAKISRGVFVVPDCLTSRARCLIRSLLRRDPSERLSAEDVLLHPWLTKEDKTDIYHKSSSDQCVPDLDLDY